MTLARITASTLRATCGLTLLMWTSLTFCTGSSCLDVVFRRFTFIPLESDWPLLIPLLC